MRRSRTVAAACASAALTLVAPALAQDVALAETLFNRGVADMMAGRYDAGCPAIAESHRLDPRPGRLFTLAECEAKWGHLATAVARYNDYLLVFSNLPPSQQAKQHGREKIAAAQRDAIAPQVPELTLVLPPGTPAGTVVQRDGLVLNAPALGLGMPVDPGEHVITTQAPGGPVKEARVRLEKGEKRSLTLEVEPAPAATTPETPRAKAPPVTSPAAAPRDREERGGGRRVAAYVAGGIGLVGLAVGGVTGGLALARSGEAEENCVDGDEGVALCNHEGKVAGDGAKMLGLVSTIGFGVGIAGLGTAAILLLTGSSGAEAGATARGGGGAARAWVGGTREGAVVGVRGTW